MQDFIDNEKYVKLIKTFNTLKDKAKEYQQDFSGEPDNKLKQELLDNFIKLTSEIKINE